ncbi:MAG: hypothetical protein JXK07_07015 [Spirochaetes bacterium]|nr:hypothetical protein [Spirochaetota bacterium]MBN2770617.1 hypothetical protein [Spirochaetota bacterium]
MKKFSKSILIFLTIILTSFLLFIITACDGDDDDNDSNDVNPKGKWMAVLDEEIEAPSPETVMAKAILMEVTADDSTIIFYDNEANQVSGMKSDYTVDVDAFQLTSTHMWLDRDPEEGITFTGTGWYEIPDEVETLNPEFTIDDDTMAIDKDGMKFSLIKTDFSVLSDLVGSWSITDSDVTFNSDGTFSYSHGGTTGSGTWEASGTESGYLRQIITEMSDDPDCSYYECINPYVLVGDTLTVYFDFDLSTGYDYIKE